MRDLTSLKRGLQKLMESHEALDLLAGKYLRDRPDRDLTNTNVLEFIEWSNAEIKKLSMAIKALEQKSTEASHD